MIYLEQNSSVNIGKTSNNGGLNMAMITFDMITSRGKCQLLTVKDIVTSVRNWYGSATPASCFICVVHDIYYCYKVKHIFLYNPDFRSNEK